jgi:hypothetical protein
VRERTLAAGAARARTDDAAMVRARAAALLSSFVLQVACGLAAQDVVRTGKTFAVTLHPGELAPELATRLADEALAALEAQRPLLDKLQVRPAAPLALHLHADAAAFRALEREHVKAPVPVDAFALADGSSGHVLLAPALSSEALAVLGVPPSVVQSLLQVGALALARTVSETARHDGWLAEVFAVGVAEASTNGKLASGVDPAFDARRERLAALTAAGQGPKLQDLVAATTLPRNAEQVAERAATTAVIAQLMAGTGTGWAKKLLARPGKVQGLLPDRLALVESVLGKDWVKTEARFATLLASLRPRWQIDGPMVAVRGNQLVLAGTASDSCSLRWVPEPPPGGYAVRGTFRIAAAGTKQFRVQLDWDGTSLLGVFFQPGRVTLEQWSPDQPWKVLETGEAAIEADTPFAVAIEVDGGLRVLVDGKVALTATPGRSMRGMASVAANDTVVFAEQLRLEPIAPPKK